MSTPDWYSLPETITEDDYEALPMRVCRTIEVVYGHVIRCQSPVRQHNRAARRLAEAIEHARTPDSPCMMVDTDIDVILWRVPDFTFRRPDVVVYECLDSQDKLTAARTMMVTEVTSPATKRADLLDKKAQYAAAGIPVYLVLVMDEVKPEISHVREFRLDPATREYRLHAEHRGILRLEYPVRADIAFSDLLA
jgi:Uma2 family endonuclease